MRRVFYSFHYQKDYWRVNQVRNIGKVEGNPIASPNEWEEIKRSGNNAIKNWIVKNLQEKSCLVVLIGEETASRPWVLFEIETAWNKGMGVLGVYIDELKDSSGQISKRGKNPFELFEFDNGFRVPLSNSVPMLDPQKIRTNNFFLQFCAETAYSIIRDNLEKYIEEAIENRKNLAKHGELFSRVVVP